MLGIHRYCICYLYDSITTEQNFNLAKAHVMFFRKWAARGLFTVSKRPSQADRQKTNFYLFLYKPLTSKSNTPYLILNMKNGLILYTGFNDLHGDLSGLFSM